MAYETHQDIDRLNLEGHRLIASKLRENHLPIIQEARKRVLRHGEPIPMAWQEWLDKFDQLSLEQLIEWITQDNDEGQRIRQSTPLTFCLSSQERQDLIERCENLISSS